MECGDLRAGEFLCGGGDGSVLVAPGGVMEAAAGILLLCDADGVGTGVAVVVPDWAVRCEWAKEYSQPGARAIFADNVYYDGGDGGGAGVATVRDDEVASDLRGFCNLWFGVYCGIFDAWGVV